MRSPFYGWFVVAAAFTVMMIGFGIAYSFSAFFEPLAEEFAADRADISLVFSIAGLLYFGLGAVSGPLADRVGGKWVSIFGMLLIAVGLLLASQAESLLAIYLAYGLSVGIGVGFSYVPAIGTVQRWFVRQRGAASGFAVTGIGVGTLVMPLFAASLIAQADWRMAYLVLAALALAGAAIALLFLDDDPKRFGLRPDGEAGLPEVGGNGGQAEGLGLGEAMASAPFWLLFISALLVSFGIFIPFVHLTPFASDQGLSRDIAVAMVPLIGVGSVLGRFAIGGLADRFGRRRSFLTMFVGLTGSLVVWYFSTGALALALFAIAFGAFYGGFVALAPALTADFFGVRRASSIIGVLYSSVGLGTCFGPVLAGYAYDQAQSYALPILLSAGLASAGSVLVWLLPEPDVWRENRARGRRRQAVAARSEPAVAPVAPAPAVEIGLRRAGAEDLAFIQQVEARPDYTGLIEQWPADLHQAMLERPDVHYLIGQGEDGHPLGFVILMGIGNRDSAVELKRIAVNEPGRGTGRALLKAVCDYAFIRLQANRFWLDVVPENARALRAYRNAGFHVEGTLREAIRQGGSFRSLIIMSLLAREYADLAARDMEATP